LKWRKLGCIFCPQGNYPWMMSHAANPVAAPREDGRVRVYFSCRDRHKRSSVGFVDLDMAQPTRVYHLSAEPVLLPGEPGTFDDSGISIGCVVPDDAGESLLYYLGWNLGHPTPWRTCIGLARLYDGDRRAVRYSLAPLVDRAAVDPLSLSYPWVLREGGRWRMWYGSHLTWGDNPPESMVHVLKHAESRDGLTWQRDGRVVLGQEWLGHTHSRLPGAAHAFARPCVLRDGDGYKMWYSYRGQSYRIGYAISADGLNWRRRDEEVGIDVSASGWDSAMIDYPCVFDHRGSRYLFYCGNGYGQTGFGIAVLEHD
jgi:hypothetical protein